MEAVEVAVEEGLKVPKEDEEEEEVVLMRPPLFGQKVRTSHMRMQSK